MQAHAGEGRARHGLLARRLKDAVSQPTRKRCRVGSALYPAPLLPADWPLTCWEGQSTATKLMALVATSGQSMNCAQVSSTACFTASGPCSSDGAGRVLRGWSHVRLAGLHPAQGMRVVAASSSWGPPCSSVQTRRHSTGKKPARRGRQAATHRRQSRCTADGRG